MSIKFLFLILLILIFAFDGMRDGFVYNIRDYNKKNDPDEHLIYSVHRLFYCLPFIWLIDPLTVLFSFLLFPFFHDGVYYYTRNMLNPTIYKKRFLDQSHTSTAKISMDWEARYKFLIVGILLCTLSIVAQHSY